MNIVNILFSLKGRISRKTYWLFCGLPLLLAGFFIQQSHIHFSPSQQILFILIIIWPSVAMHVKRWHDQDKSGWWQLISIIPILGGLIVMVICGFVKGTSGPNRFGDDPLTSKT